MQIVEFPATCVSSRSLTIHERFFFRVITPRSLFMTPIFQTFYYVNNQQEFAMNSLAFNNYIFLVRACQMCKLDAAGMSLHDWDTGSGIWGSKVTILLAIGIFADSCDGNMIESAQPQSPLMSMPKLINSRTENRPHSGSTWNPALQRMIAPGCCLWRFGTICCRFCLFVMRSIYHIRVETCAVQSWNLVLASMTLTGSASDSASPISFSLL